jgi:hypothetical protein
VSRLNAGRLLLPCPRFCSLSLPGFFGGDERREECYFATMPRIEVRSLVGAR